MLMLMLYLGLWIMDEWLLGHNVAIIELFLFLENLFLTLPLETPYCAKEVTLSCHKIFIALLFLQGLRPLEI